MSLRTLGPLAKLSFLCTFAIALAGCGSSGRHFCPPVSAAASPADACFIGSPPYLYATTTTNRVLVFTVDTNSGALTALPSSPGPANSTGIVNFHFSLLFADPSSNQADGFGVAVDTGALTPVAGSPFTLASGSGGPVSIFNPFAGSVYATEPDGTIVGFSGPGDGTLTAPVPGSPFAAGIAPSHLASAGLTASSALYVSDQADANGGVLGFNADMLGTLTPMSGSPFATLPDAGPTAMQTVLGTSQIFLYVSLTQVGKVAGFAVDPTTGFLTPVPGSPFTVGNGPSYLAEDFGNLRLYVMNATDPTISGFTVNPSNGTLTVVAGSPFAAGTASGGLLFYPGPSPWLYVADTVSSKILFFTINSSTGALTPGSPSDTTSPPIEMTNVFFPAL